MHRPSNPITGPGYEYIVTGGASFALAYPAASADQSKAAADPSRPSRRPPHVVPASGWAYARDQPGEHRRDSQRRDQADRGNFVNNDIYEFSYTAKNPTVNGLGFAAIRDFNSFLRFASHDDFGTPNPIKSHVDRIYTETSSQPARTLNDFVHLGFNEDESHRQVFDGMMQWIGAGDGINMNYRWSQTKRTNRNRQELLYLEGLYPFRQRADLRSDFGHQRLALQEMRGDPHLPAGHGILFGQRVLGESRLADEHRPDRNSSTCRIIR